MFLVLEGGDGTGKSTLREVLVQKLGAIPYSTPPAKYLVDRHRVDELASPEEHYRFYRDGIYDASAEIEELLHNGKTVVCDRYWLTTYTYHRIMGVRVSADDFKSVVAPDLTVILALSHSMQVERMTQRGLSAGDHRMIDKQREIASAFYNDAIDLDIPFIVIDTKFSPESCADIVATAIKAINP
jgi:thymidylate kinase